MSGSPVLTLADRSGGSRGRVLFAMIAGRLVFIPLALLAIVTLSFLLVSLIPGDPALAILGSSATQDEVAKIHAQLLLDRPLAERYVLYLASVLQGDLGTSFFSGASIRAEIGKHLPASIELVAMALTLGAVLGIAIGAVAGYWRGTGIDRTARTAVTGLQAIPEFLIGLLLIFTLFYLWRIAPPPLGRLGILDRPPPAVTGFLLVDLIIAGNWKTLGVTLHRSMLPVLTLALGVIPMFAKITRSSVAVTLGSKGTQFARACGLSEWRIVHYALLQARTPILTYTAMLFGAMVGGSAIVETMFSWAGLGQWGLKAILQLDVPAIQGFVIATGLLTMVVYLLLDIAVILLDPRVKHD